MTDPTDLFWQRRSRPLYYRLDGHIPVPVPDAVLWAAWFETTCTPDGVDARRVAATDLTDNIRVSTVFLGIDHAFGASTRPILFETLVFGGELDGQMERYGTWAEAERGHAAMVARVEVTLPPRPKRRIEVQDG